MPGCYTDLTAHVALQNRERQMNDSSYLTAPATKMLATHCAVCARALVDAKSVELGIGPDCRKKYG